MRLKIRKAKKANHFSKTSPDTIRRANKKGRPKRTAL
jgi:hypothetical protein